MFSQDFRMNLPCRRFRACCHAAALAAVLLFSGCPSRDAGPVSSAPASRRLVLLTNGTSPFWDAASVGANNAARDLKLDQHGLTIVFDRGDFTVETQLEKLKQYGLASDVAGVAISVTDENSVAIVDELRALKQAGVKVITIDSDVDRATARDAREAYIGTDNVAAGRELGKAAAALLPEGGQYSAFVGLKGATNARERIGGFKEGAGDKFQELEVFGDGGQPETARKNTRDALDRQADIDMLVGIWSYNTPAIVDIVKEMGVRERIKVVGFDADPPAITGMEEGFVDVMLVQNPYEMGYQGVRLLQALLSNDESAIREILPDRGQENGDIHDTGLKIVAPNDGSPLKADLFDQNTQFLSLGEFKAWLEEHGLTGS
jgi:ribose transport system substrate-binding protein